MTHPARSLMDHPVLIVDDHPVVRRALEAVIDEAVDLEVCGEADDDPEALRRIEATQPHIVIVDIPLGDEDRLELIDYIQSRRPGCFSAPTSRALVIRP
jgi:DNA-binding NarL/FixJ family response regulator